MLVSDLYCPSCRNAKDHKPQDNEICWSCVAMGGAGNYKESKTHGDQLRSMTDEELAEFLGENDSNFPIGDHKKKWLEWLKKVASE